MAVAKRKNRRALPVDEITFSPLRQYRLAAALEFLEDEGNRPATARQVFYSLVSRHVIENTEGMYEAVLQLLVDARRVGIVPWEWIEDRNRRPRHVQSWSALPEFLHTVRRAYRRDIWQTQPEYFEVWEEKDALSGIFEGVLRPYGVTLNVGRGYDSWDSINNAAERYKRIKRPVTILYFGDFDPSGEDMVRSLEWRLNDRGAYPDIIKCALTLDEVRTYNLPPAAAKKTDSRRDAFVEKYGDMAVELDALPRRILEQRIAEEVERYMDMDALRETLGTQDDEQAQVDRMIDAMEESA